VAIPVSPTEIASADLVSLATTGRVTLRLLRHCRVSQRQVVVEIAEPVPKRKRGISLLAMTKRSVTNVLNEDTH
jgi:hypothetical protein